MLRTPYFWSRKYLVSYLLLPFTLFYFCGFFLAKFFARPKKVSKPVICIGNLIAGGSGKTPVAIAVGKILQKNGIKFAFLSRGYAGEGVSFLQLEKNCRYNPEIVGDEALLLAEHGSTFIATNRFFGANQIARINEMKAIVMDDGMQNNTIQRDLNFCVIDGGIGFGNEFLLPAGPMREGLNSGLKKADLFIMIGEDKRNLLPRLPADKVVKAKIIPVNLNDFCGKKLIAFCGLGYPRKFFEFLGQCGLELLEVKAFPDHYFYQMKDLENLIQEAKEKGASLITTKKDWVKFGDLFKEKIGYLDVELQFEDEKKVVELILKELESFDS